MSCFLQPRLVNSFVALTVTATVCTNGGSYLDDADRVLDRDEPLALRVKNKAKRVRARCDGGFGILQVGDSANFNAHGHSVYETNSRLSVLKVKVPTISSHASLSDA